MKILIIGLGSIGKRHLLNLKSLGFNNITVLRSKKSIQDKKFDQKFGTKTLYSLPLALAQKPTAVFITNPTYLHITTAIQAAKADCHLFIEKPLSHNIKRVNELIDVANKKMLITLVGCNQRFHPQLKKIKKIIDQGRIGRVLSSRLEVGQYLPDWHPDEDYTRSYAAKKSMGGGVILTLIHEIDYIYSILGGLKKLVCFAQPSKTLKIDCEDNAEILAYSNQGALIEIHLDYLQRALTRQYQFFGTKGSILWDYLTSELKVYTATTNKWEVYRLKKYDRNQMFIEELRHFLKCVKRKEKTINTVSGAFTVLKIALAAKKSNITNKIINL